MSARTIEEQRREIYEIAEAIAPVGGASGLSGGCLGARSGVAAD